MKNVEKKMHQLNKKLSTKHKEDVTVRPTEPARRFELPEKFCDTEAEIEKAFVEYLKENNEMPDETLMRYISQITR